VVAFHDLKMSYRSRKAGHAVVGGVEVFDDAERLSAFDGVGSFDDVERLSALAALVKALTSPSVWRR
jgi:hypothetical protein